MRHKLLPSINKSCTFNLVGKSAIIFLHIIFLSLSTAWAQDSLQALLKTKLPAQEHLDVLEKLIEANKFENRPQSLAYGKQANRFASNNEETRVRAKGLELLGYAYYINFEFDSSVLYLKQGLNIAGDIPAYNEKLFYYLGDAFWYNGHFDSALVYQEKGQKSALQTQNLSLLATLTINIADYYRQTGNFDKALDIYWEGIAYAIQDKSRSMLPKAYNNTALLYGYIGDTYTELDYYFKAVEAAETPCCNKILPLLYANIAEAYTTLGDYQKALKYSAIGIEKSDAAHQLRYSMIAYEILGVLHLAMDSIPASRAAFMESIRLNEQVKDKRFIARNLGNLGDVERRAKNYKKAILNYELAIAAQDQIAERKFKTEDLLGLSQTHLLLGNLLEATRNNDEALRLAKMLGIRTVIAQSYLLSSNILMKKGATKEALTFRVKYDSIHSVLEKEERLKYVNNLEKLNRAKQKELENLTLKKDMEMQAEVIDRQKKLFVYGTILIIGLLAISFFIYALLRKNQHAKQLISTQNEALKNKNEEIQAINDQQENLMHLVVHDLRSPLNKIEGLVSILRLEGELNTGQSEVVKMMEEVSKKSKSFISEFLETTQIQYRSRQPKKEFFDTVPFLEAIQKEYAPHASKKEIELVCDFNLPPQKAYSDEGLLYHIVINLLSNAIKYSPPNTCIQLSAWCQGKDLHLSIKDQGQGFSELDKQSLYKKFQRLSAQPIGPESSTGLGLFLTKMLVDSLNGKITLESEAKKGSTFTLVFSEIYS
ncbi:MAG: ATP-binding protein [Cyclobacteriaceae bacterium]